MRRGNAALPFHLHDEPLRTIVVALRSGLLFDGLCNLGKDRADPLRGGGMCGVDHALAHLIGRARQQLAEHLARQLPASCDCAGKIAVIARALDEIAQRHVGETRAVVRRDLASNRHVATLDQHVGNRFIEGRAARDRREMCLALGARNGDQRLVIEAIRTLKHGAGDLDRVVMREAADQAVGRIVDAGDAVAQFDHGLPLDFLDQFLEHVVEHADLLVARARRGGDEQIGHPAQHFGAPLARSGLDGGFKFRDQGGLG